MPAIAMSPTLSPKEVFEMTTGSSPIIWPSCATRRKAPATSKRRRERFCTDKATSKIG